MKLVWAFPFLLHIVQASPVRSFQMIFSPATWFYFRFILFSVIYCLVIFQLSSYHNFPLLNSLNVLSTIIEKELQTIVRSYISSSLIAAFYISLNCSCWCLWRWFTGILSAAKSQNQFIIIIFMTANCQRIVLLVLLSLNLTYCISVSTSGRVFPHNKASSFLPSFLLMEQHHYPVCSWGLTLISLVFTSSCIHLLLSNIAESNPHMSIHPDTET